MLRKYYEKLIQYLRHYRWREERIHFGRNVTLGKFNDFDGESTGKMHLGHNTWIGDMVKLFSYDGHINIGNNTFIGHYCIVYGHGGVNIGKDVMIAAHTVIVSQNHKFDDMDKLIRAQGMSNKGIKIGNNCWIGTNVNILDGVTLGDGCVVGAGSVVTKSFPENSVIAGSPAKLIKKRGE